jgi:hypothetical protein
MNISLPRLKALASSVHYFQGREMRVINRNSRSVPGALLSEVVTLAREIHQLVRGGSTAPMSEYTDGRCCFAAEKMAFHIYENKTKGMVGDLARGTNVPGSSGRDKNFNGLHYLSLLRLPNEVLAVDVTAAQLKGENSNFKNTEVLIVVGSDETILSEVTAVYHGGWWQTIPFGSLLR